MKRFASISTVLLVFSAPLVATYLTTAPTFSRVTYPATGIRGITVGDFNGDGHLDFAAATYKAPTELIVYVGDGSGAMTLADQFPLRAGPFGITSADLNHDGRAEVIVTSADTNSLEIITWDAVVGGFHMAATRGTSRDPREVVAGDFNRDGDIDIALATFGCNCVEIWPGTGTLLTFGAPMLVTRMPGAHGLAVADFNRDGILDLVVTNANAANATVLFGDGTGAFPNHLAIATGAGPRNVAIGDFNQDGWLDFATVNTNGKSITVASGVRATPGSLTSTFTKRTLATGPDLQSPRDIEAVDANGDGKLDLVFVDFNTGNMWVFLGDGDGHFGPHEGVNSSTDGVFADMGARTIAAGDLDEDGRLDLLIGSQTSGSVALFLNQTAFRGRR